MHYKNIDNRKRIRRIIVTILVVIALICATIFLVKAFSNQLSSIEAIATVASVIAAGAGLIYESNATRSFQEAEFLLQLNMAFTDNSDTTAVYEFLEHEYFSAQKDIENPYKEKPMEISRIQISNYLTFFESVYLLKSTGSVTLAQLDDLFGYRFFLAVHSPYIQKEKLLSQPSNFKNIYKLEKEWMAYRRHVGSRIFGEENSLEINYKKLLESNPSDATLPTYEELIK